MLAQDDQFGHAQLAPCRQQVAVQGSQKPLQQTGFSPKGPPHPCPSAKQPEAPTQMPPLQVPPLQGVPSSFAWGMPLHGSTTKHSLPPQALEQMPLPHIPPLVQAVSSGNAAHASPHGSDSRQSF